MKPTQLPPRPIPHSSTGQQQPQQLRPVQPVRPIQSTKPAFVKPAQPKPVQPVKSGAQPGTLPTGRQALHSALGTPSGAPMQGNLSIDFSKKNNEKKPYSSRKYAGGNKDNLTSEAFIRQDRISSLAGMKDIRKLIKKDEVPVKIGNLIGLEQVGQCMFIEYKNDIIIVDAGMEFAANEELGADYIIPDISYLKKNKSKIRAILITHGHLDHVGAIKNIIEDLGYPIIYTTPLALGIIKKTFDDPKKANMLKYKTIDPDTDLIKLGCFTVEFVRVNHNIPESMALAIYTPKGVIFDSGDFKIDHTPAIDRQTDLAKIARIGTEGVKLYTGDSLGAQTPGWAKSEKIIGETIDAQIKNTKGRILIATFATNIGRVIQIVNSAIRYNRVVFLSGRSMINNIDICQQLGYINAPKGMIRKLDNDVNNMPGDRVLVLCTGAQGEEFAALTRMSRGEHAQVTLSKGDTILMSASTIPGNESATNRMFNNLLAKGVELITNNEMDVHTSGHGYAEDHKLFLSLIKPQYFLPAFDDMTHRYAHKKLALDMGIPEENIIMPVENGSIIEMYDDVVLIGDQKLKLDTILIDGKGQGHMSGEYVIKARHIMAQNGIVALIFKIDTKSNELVGNIQIESRGFVYSSEVKSIHTQIVDFARAKYNDNHKKKMEIKDNLKQIKEDLAEFIAKIIGRVPMLITMFVYINRDAQSKDLSQEETILGMTLEEQGYDD
ncbi:MAG: RNase J family beta-CASP ribonuclease [Candidatus Absconditabacterales bacterium]